MSKKYVSIPQLEALPACIYFRYDEFGADTHAPSHAHAWGQLNYTSSGVMQLEIDGQHFVSPSSYAVWIPPHANHSCYNPAHVIYRSLYVSLEYCSLFPKQACGLHISDISKSILNDFAQRQLNSPTSVEDKRLAQVLLDQLSQASCISSYLPYSANEMLMKVMHALQSDPSNTWSLAQWAEHVFVSERTLARLFVREVGISFGEWRQRLRFLCAVDELNAGKSIKEIAFDMGYSTASAFIAMFQRHAQCTPEQYRRLHE